MAPGQLPVIFKEYAGVFKAGRSQFKPKLTTEAAACPDQELTPGGQRWSGSHTPGQASFSSPEPAL